MPHRKSHNKRMQRTRDPDRCVPTRGSHRQFKHRSKSGRVTVRVDPATIWRPERSIVSSSNLD